MVFLTAMYLAVMLIFPLVYGHDITATIPMNSSCKNDGKPYHVFPKLYCFCFGAINIENSCQYWLCISYSKCSNCSPVRHGGYIAVDSCLECAEFVGNYIDFPTRTFVGKLMSLERTVGLQRMKSTAKDRKDQFCEISTECKNEGWVNGTTNVCECPPRFKGPTCEANQCIWGDFKTAIGNRLHQCNCWQNSTGPKCDRIVTCLNGGAYTSKGCMCMPSFYGKHCSQSRCYNGEYNENLHMCVCFEGYRGLDCLSLDHNDKSRSGKHISVRIVMIIVSCVVLVLKSAALCTYCYWRKKARQTRNESGCQNVAIQPTSGFTNTSHQQVSRDSTNPYYMYDLRDSGSGEQERLRFSAAGEANAPSTMQNLGGVWHLPQQRHDPQVINSESRPPPSYDEVMDSRHWP